ARPKQQPILQKFPHSVTLHSESAYLDLRFNSFTGSLPDELFNHQQLDAIFLNNEFVELFSLFVEQGQAIKNKSQTPLSS
ncbi:hypothetical protein LINPERPRIM_LOCUS3187, partial [Linum perenne]